MRTTVLLCEWTLLSCRGQGCSLRGLCYHTEDSVVHSGDCVIIQRTVLFCQRIVLSCRGQCCSLKGLCYHAADSVLAVKRTLEEARNIPCFPPFWKLNAVIWFPFRISSVFSAWSSFAFSLLIFLLTIHSPDFFFFSRTLSNYFVQSRLLLYGSCWAARKWQLVEDSLSICFPLFSFPNRLFGYGSCWAARRQ